MKVLSKARIEMMLDRLSADADVFVPMLRGQGTGFFSWKSYDEDYDEMVLDRLNVFMPPKHIIITPAEKNNINLMSGSAGSSNKIIFGIRSCDIQGIKFQDEFFAADEIESEFYKERRDQTIIIANACYYPASSCFCSSVGVDPLNPGGADIIIRDVGKEGYVWEVCTDKGELLTEKAADLLEEKEVTIPDPLPLVLIVNFDGISEKLADMNDHPLWEKHSQACQTCMLCTHTCPSCYCLDLQAAHWHKADYEFNCYETCVYKNDSLSSGDSSSIEAATDRFRNRFLHKLQFYPQHYGKPLCTGCGRCIAICPSEASITKIIAEVREG
ncbi:MAG TPA: 4Fe-4S dicluster domain-containing protein [Syntrophomonas sp.]|nr:4Fe-4S dicluster domain-containing protein [Syntrophomonas sp.]